MTAYQKKQSRLARALRELAALAQEEARIAGTFSIDVGDHSHRVLCADKLDALAKACDAVTVAYADLCDVPATVGYDEAFPGLQPLTDHIRTEAETEIENERENAYEAREYERAYHAPFADRPRD